MQFYTDFFRRGEYVYVREIKNGLRGKYKKKLSPSLYVPTKKTPDSQSVYGEPLKRVDFNSCREAKDFIERRDDVYGFPYYEYTEINDLYPTKDDLPYDYSKINIGYFDIETESEAGWPDIDTANERINAITIRSRGKTFVLGNKPLDYDIDVDYYKAFEDEADLLRMFIRIWVKLDLDIISGWNIDGFDIPYIVNRIRRVLGEDAARRLSPWGIIDSREIFQFNRYQTRYQIRGIATLDYLDLYKKFTYNQQETYKLDHIGFVELGEKKVDYSEYSSMREFYRKDYTKFVKYNVKDTILVDRLNDKMKFIQLACEIVYATKISFRDVFTTVKLWDVVIANYLKNTRNVQVPSSIKKAISTSYEGAYVMPPKVGKYQYLASFDLTSLYPSLIITYNISPETILDGKYFLAMNQDTIFEDRMEDCTARAKELDVTLCMNGTMYRKDKVGFLPELMDHYFKKRKHAKSLMVVKKKEGADPDEIQALDSKQQAFKILINSAYGAIGNIVFRYFSLDQASAITISGQTTIKWSAKAVNDFMNAKLGTTDEDYVIYIDTDSNYVNLEGVAARVREKNPDVTDEKMWDYLDAFCGMIQAELERQFEVLFDKTNGLDNRFDMKRETMGNGLFVQKKRYVIRVFDDEGYRVPEPKMKIMGLESVRSTTPSFCREKIKETFRDMFVLSREDMIDKVDAIEKEFYSLPIEDIAQPTGVNDIQKHREGYLYKKGTPAHVKASIHHNNLIDLLGLEMKYEKIKEGDKIKKIQLYDENPTGNDVIAFIGTLPPEFQLEEYIDKRTQYEKTYLNPVRKVLDIIGYPVEKKNGIFDFE